MIDSSTVAQYSVLLRQRHDQLLHIQPYWEVAPEQPLRFNLHTAEARRLSAIARGDCNEVDFQWVTHIVGRDTGQPKQMAEIAQQSTLDTSDEALCDVLDDVASAQEDSDSESESEGSQISLSDDEEQEMGNAITAEVDADIEFTEEVRSRTHIPLPVRVPRTTWSLWAS